METQWRIELLGGLRACCGERVITRFRTQKTGALLGCLAYHLQRPPPREALVEILWPDEEFDSARHKLSVALSSLRQALEPPGVPDGAVVTTGHFAVGLNPASVTTDVAEFEAALHAAAGGASTEGPAGEETARWLERAVALYQGPLLPGYYEEWIPAEQQRLQQLYLRALGRLTGHFEGAGELDRALEYALRAVSADPLREEAHRDVMRLQLAVGQPSAALGQYRELERILREELAAVPSGATQALALQIEAGREMGKLEIE